MYIVRLNQGDYYQHRGGFDWGRTIRNLATVFDSREQAEGIADWLKPFGARVEEYT